MIRIVVTGSECTGKTTLASRLASHFKTLWVPEYSREYARARGRELTYEDVEPIARGQMTTEEQIAGNADSLLFQDTDLLSTFVYSNHYYDRCPDWIEGAVRARLPNLYLLLHPDVPWIADGIRDRGDRREEIHALFEQALKYFGAPFAHIRGSWQERQLLAIKECSTVIHS